MKNVKDLKILVIGDIMIDRYVIGNVERISPEAPVPVVDVSNEYCTLGGCGNVAKNLARIGVQTYCISACGTSEESNTLISLMKDKNIVSHMAHCRNRLTTIKERIIAKDRSTQLLRIDRETRAPVEAGKILVELGHLIYSGRVIPDIILISDYNKGVITRDLMREIEDISFKKNIKIIIDPKPENEQSYGCAYAITPNIKEYHAMKTLESVRYTNIIVTKGSEGVCIFRMEDGGNPIDIPAEKVDVFNVTGAGDSFVSVFSTCVGMGIDVLQSSRIANKCAAHVVTRPGTSSVPIEIFENAVKSIFPKGDFI